MKFVTIAGPDSGEFSGKPVMLVDDVLAWVAAGKPALNNKQLGALCRTLAYNTDRNPEELVQFVRAKRAAFLLSQSPARPVSPSRLPSNPTSSRPTKAGRTAGNPPKGSKMATAGKLRKKARKQLKQIRRHLLDRGADPAECEIMLAAGADRDMRRLWLDRYTDSPAVTLDADDRERAAYMLSEDVEPELRAMFLAQQAGPEPAPVSSSPLGMPDDRYQLHQQAKVIAADRCRVDPNLDDGEAYVLAVEQLLDGPSVI